MTYKGQGLSKRFQNYIILSSFGVILKNVCKLLLEVPQIVKLKQNDINKNCRGKNQFLNEFKAFSNIFSIYWNILYNKGH